MRKRYRIVTFAALGAMVAALLLFVFTAFGVQEHLQHMVAQRRWVLHTQEVLLLLSDVDRKLADVESAARGFVVTGHDNYEDDYNKSKAKALLLVGKLVPLVDDNPRQELMSAQLAKLITAKLSELDRPIFFRKSGSKDKAIQYVLSDEGKQSMSGIKTCLTLMIDEEERLLKARSSSLEQATAEMSTRLLLMAAGGGFLLFLAVFGIQTLFSARSNELFSQELVHAVSGAILRHTTLAAALSEMPKVLCELMETEAAVLWTLNKNNKLACAGFYSRADMTAFESASRHLLFDSGVGLPGRVWASKAPAWISDATKDANFPRAPVALQAGLHGAQAFPIMVGDKFIGVIEFFSKKVERPDQSRRKAFIVIGQEIGQLIDRQQAHEKVATMHGSLKESEGKFKALFDYSFEFTMLLSPDGAILKVNQTCLDTFEVKEREVLGRMYWDAPWWPQTPQFKAALKAHLNEAAGGRIARFEGEQRSTSGKVFAVDVSLTPIMLDNKTVTGIVAEAHDITAKVESDRRVSEFYSTISHELRTPLTSIRASLGLMEGGKAGELSAKATQLVKIARSESDRLIRLINDILDFRKIEAGMLELTKVGCRPSELVDSVLEGLSSMSGAADVLLESRIFDDRLVFCDRDRFVQVLTNLVSNAIKYAPAQTRVRVTVQATPNSRMRFSVSDKGPGIPNDKMDKLFVKFQQLDSSDARAKEGTGLGLAIAKAIVEQHDGRIGVESSAGQGSTFWFELPLLLEANVDGRQEMLPGQRWRVLVVEDDVHLTEILKATLAPEGFEVLYAPTLAKADTILSETVPDAILLDIKLPDGNGLERLDLWRSQTALKEVPVVVLSGRKPDSKSAGTPLLIDWITKPFDEKRLKKSLRMAVRKSPEAPPQVLIVEDDATTLEFLTTSVKALGAECLVAQDGPQALELCKSEDLDLIILDIGLPGLDGFDVVESLRKDKDSGSTPLIVYTSRDLTPHDRERLTLGLTRHLIKSRSSEENFERAVLDLLNGLVDLKRENGQET